jgi:hypothetical protein
MEEITLQKAVETIETPFKTGTFCHYLSLAVLPDLCILFLPVLLQVPFKGRLAPKVICLSHLFLSLVLSDLCLFLSLLLRDVRFHGLAFFHRGLVLVGLRLSVPWDGPWLPTSEQDPATSISGKELKVFYLAFAYAFALIVFVCGVL